MQGVCVCVCACAPVTGREGWGTERERERGIFLYRGSVTFIPYHIKEYGDVESNLVTAADPGRRSSASSWGTKDGVPSTPQR